LQLSKLSVVSFGSVSPLANGSANQNKLWFNKNT
jgi:hypothetical protein